MLGGARRGSLAAQLLPQILPVRTVRAATRREDRAQDPLPQSAGSGRRQDRQRHRRGRPVSRPESADRRSGYGHHALRRHQGEGISGRDHRSGNPHVDGGLGVEDRAPAGGGNRAARGDAGPFDHREHPVGVVLWDSCHHPVVRRGCDGGIFRGGPAGGDRDGRVRTAFRGRASLRCLCPSFPWWGCGARWGLAVKRAGGETS